MSAPYRYGDNANVAGQGRPTAAGTRAREWGLLAFLGLAGLVAAGQLLDLGAVAEVPFALLGGWVCIDLVRHARKNWRDPDPPPSALRKLGGAAFWDNLSRGLPSLAVAVPCLYVATVIGRVSELTAESVTRPVEVVIALLAIVGVPAALLSCTTWLFGFPRMLVPPRLRR